ncbi:putative spermidine/putrescine transport system ATP-binding protein [Stella humosa]|uniref:Spermidine/putrescine import ATP-binding protein PotA n=1 Tax=Stella humosa TaxID=94 RepID=A0A3N1L2Y8_9PROT|nr:ABC transporter ATP-binding protein [Stella humosa]ROP83775.1 putative spermidine/putrescine transport system ATP-binding protein [Stella humosa]BBK32964.1 polyamine-transporting ATPase [Stella humosa]
MTAAARAFTPATDPLVAFVGVSKRYGAPGAGAAVAGLDLDIGRGEFVTFLGPSGSGKTTSLMMLAGFETPTEGDILVAGRSVRRIPPHRRNIGVVFQHYALFPHMTVGENVAFPLSVRGIGREEAARRVDKALDLVRLGGYGRRRPAELSGGQQQRVALARALVFGPDIVLMDEPLGALDKQLREQLQLEIKHIHDGLGVTIVYVTHDQSEALTLSDRIAVFKDGRVDQVGSPTEIYERPTTAFVARFIGESNRLDGQVRSVDGRHCVVETTGGVVIRALNAGGFGPGQATTLSVRPERISPLEPGTSPDNQVAARVEELIYHGDHVRARLGLPGANGFVVKVANSAGTRPLAAGEMVELGWSADDCRALDPLPAD